MATINYTINRTFTINVPAAVASTGLYESATTVYGPGGVVDLTSGGAQELIDDITAEYQAITGLSNLSVAIAFNDPDLLVVISYTWNSLSTSERPLGFFAEDQTAIFETATPEQEVCSDCVTVDYAACQSSYKFITGLVPNNNYVVYLNKGWFSWYDTVMSDENGDLTIDVSDVDNINGLTIPESGHLKVTVKSSIYAVTDELMTNSIDSFYCIRMNFIYMTATSFGSIVNLIGDENNFIIVTENNDAFIVS